MKRPVLDVVKNVASADRRQLLNIREKYQALSRDTLRRLIIDQDRIDVLATEILGYSVTPMHFAMMRWQFLHPDNLQLVFRGAGKSTTCTVAKTIHLLIKDRDLRVLIASKTKGNAEGFLAEIKGHFENNTKLIDTFGAFFDPHRVTKWDNSEINVVGRKLATKESSVTTVGVDSAVVSKHYDVIISDDLVDEDNARTKHMRDKLRGWYYTTLDPTLMPPEPGRRHVGEHHRLGTRYHYADIYGHWIENDLKGRVQVIPALDEKGRSPWPERYTAAWFEKKRAVSGAIIFAAQYQCSTELMKGEIFQYDQCVQLNSSEWPNEQDLKIFMGVDLAISEKDKNDQFAIVVIGCRGRVMAGGKSDFEVFVLDYYVGHLGFPKQTPKFFSLYDKWQPIQAGVESNAYQAAQYQTIKHQRPQTRVLPIHTDKDKITRAWKLAALFDAGKVFFKKGTQGPLIDQLILFPSHDKKDLFDALDLAVQTAKRRSRDRSDRQEPGLL